MIKLLGTAMIVLGSGSAGFGFARAVRAQLRQLNALLAALEAMKGEIEYRLTPLPELFAALGEGTEPVTAAFFRGCAAMMEADRALPPQLVLGRAMEQTTSLQWSARTRETVRNLAFSLGKFDLGGQVRAIELAQERLRAELAGWTVKTALRAAVAAFTAYLTLTGLLAGAADEMTLKAAKSVISTAIPVVGGMISEASQAVLTSAALIRNSAGIFGLLAVLAVGLGPFLQIAVQYLALRVTTALSGFLAMQEHTKLLACAADAMGYMLAMTGSAMLMVIVAVCAFLKAVNG